MNGKCCGKAFFLALRVFGIAINGFSLEKRKRKTRKKEWKKKIGASRKQNTPEHERKLFVCIFTLKETHTPTHIRRRNPHFKSYFALDIILYEPYKNNSVWGLCACAPGWIADWLHWFAQCAKDKANLISTAFRNSIWISSGFRQINKWNRGWGW